MIAAIVNGAGDATIVVGAMTMIGVMTTALLQRQGNKGGADFSRKFQEFQEENAADHMRVYAEMKSLREDASAMFTLFAEHVSHHGDYEHASHAQKPRRQTGRPVPRMRASSNIVGDQLVHADHAGRLARQNPEAVAGP